MTQELDDLRNRLEQLRDLDISHEEKLGAANSFKVADEDKGIIVAQLLELITSLEDVSDVLPPGYISRSLLPLRERIAKLEKLRDQVEVAAKNQDTGGDFPSKRSSLHEFSKNLRSEGNQQIEDLEMMIRFAKTTRDFNLLESTSQFSELSGIVKSLKSSKAEADAIVDTIRGSASKAAVGISLSSYSSLSEDHGRRERAWFILAIIAFCFLSLAAGEVIWGDSISTSHEIHPAKFEPNSGLAAPDNTTSDISVNRDTTPREETAGTQTLIHITTPAAILLVMRNALLVAAPLLLLRISLTKYNAERHLRILYNHRIAALKQLQILEATIADGNPARDELRLEAAKMILGDPRTSYASLPDSTELNISPVFAAVEKVAGKS